MVKHSFHWTRKERGPMNSSGKIDNGVPMSNFKEKSNLIWAVADLLRGDYVVTGKTAAEIILDRADADKPNMALTSWKGSVVRKQDILMAKIYLTEHEIDTLNRLVVIFLETAELRAKNRFDITMKFWHENVDRILTFNEQPLLKGKGTISNPEMEEKVREIYGLFDAKRKENEALQADQDDLEELKLLEEKIEKSK